MRAILDIATGVDVEISEPVEYRYELGALSLATPPIFLGVEMVGPVAELHESVPFNTEMVPGAKHAVRVQMSTAVSGAVLYEDVLAFTVPNVNSGELLAEAIARAEAAEAQAVYWQGQAGMYEATAEVAVARAEVAEADVIRLQSESAAHEAAATDAIAREATATQRAVGAEEERDVYRIGLQGHARAQERAVQEA